MSVCSVQPDVGQLALASVDGDDDPLAVSRQRLVEEVDIGVGGGSQDHARHARRQRPPDSGDRAQPAPELDRHVDLGDDPLHVVQVGRLAAAGAVEVDDVERAGARLHPAASGVERVGVVVGPLVELAPREPDRLALEDVNRRQEDHGDADPAHPAGAESRHSVTKLLSSANPSREDFSG